MKARALILLAALATLASTAAAAGDPLPVAPSPGDGDLSDLEGLLDEPILSTASKSAEVASAAPATSMSISAADLRRHGIRSLDEAINFLSLGMITQNPLHSVDIGARGVLLTSDFGNHVLLLVDGHTVNEPWNGTAYFERGAAIPFEMIDHIEIILGPGSVLYGSNAMMGVINVITKRAKNWGGLHLIAESELGTSHRLAAGLGHEFSLFDRPAELTIQLEYFKQDGPHFRFGPQVYGDDAVTMAPKRFSPEGLATGVWGGVAEKSYWTKIPAGYARLIVGRLELNVKAASYTRGTPYINLFNLFAADFNDPNTWEKDRWLSGDLKYRLPLSEIIELKSRLYADTYTYEQQARTSAAEDCEENQLFGCIRRSKGLSRWMGLEEQASFDWTRDGDYATLLGVDGRWRYAGSQLDITDRVTGVNPGSVGYVRKTEYALGVYLQQTAKPHHTLDLSAGVRFDADQRFGSHVSPRAAVALRLWDGGTLKGIYSEAFRAPSIYEAYFADPANQVDATDLSPEKVRSVEALAEQRIGTHRLLVGGFRSWWRDMVLLAALTPEEIEAAVNRGQLSAGVTSALQYRNVASIENYGMNASFEGTQLAGKLRYGANFTLAWAHRTLADGSSLDLTVTPKVFGNARVSYDLPGDLPEVGLVALMAGRRLADRANDGGFEPTPYAPRQLELRATISGAVPWVEGLSYRGTMNMAASHRNPYVVGPRQAATPDQTNAELSPVDTFRLGFGLQYDFGR
jgi:outer membrane receptor for ferrienterochelin and colicins